MDEESKDRGLHESFSPYVFVRIRQMEGTYPHDQGAWLTSRYRILYSMGDVSVEEWQDDNWLNPVEPEGIDKLAAKNRIGVYFRIRNSWDCKRILKQGAPVQAAFEIWDQWYTAKNGIIFDIPENVVPHESHSVMIYREWPEYDGLIFANTWGHKWGQMNQGAMSTHYFDKWLIDSLHPYKTGGTANKPKHISGTIYREYMAFQGYKLTYHHSVIFDATTQDRLGWCTALVHRSGKFIEIEELFVLEKHRGKGYGRILAQYIKELSVKLNLYIVARIPFVDCYENNHGNIIRMAKLLKLRVAKGDVPWAGYRAYPGKTNASLPSIRIPARPKGKREEVEHEAAPTGMTADDEDRLWSELSMQSLTDFASETPE